MRFVLDVIDYTASTDWGMTSYQDLILASKRKYNDIYTIEMETNRLGQRRITVPVIKNNTPSDTKEDLEQFFDIREERIDGYECYILDHPKTPKHSVVINSQGMTINSEYGEATINLDKGNPIKLGREEVLETALSLITGDRAEQYDTQDDATGNFQRIADLWTPVLGREITPTEVALCLIQLKVARVITSNGHQDSWVDIAGYAGLGFEVSDNA